MTICFNVLGVMKEQKEYLLEENRNQADINHFIEQADNVTEIEIFIR